MAFLGADLAPLVAFAQAHAAWAAPFAFALAFLESLAFISLLVPSTLVILTLGALINAAGVSFVSVWLGVSLGAALGDWLSYAIGYRVKGRVGLFWPFNRHPELLPRGERFFRRWGAMSVVMCRFFHPLRATVPLLCGVFEMPALPFQIANWLSALVWAGALLGPARLVLERLF